MRVLVTGGAGFIGYHLCRRLHEEGCVITAFDNLSTGSEHNIPLFVKLVKGDVLREFPNDKFDWIFNLACPASPIWYQKDPIKTSLTNVSGAYESLELAKRFKSRVFQASTSEIYGDPLISPQREDYLGNVNPIGVRACYDEGKRFAETLFYDYQRQHGVDIRVARIFNTYGPRMAIQDGRVISNFIVQALRGEPITVYGDGSQTRSFCYVDDLVDGIILLMKSNETRPVNLGNDEEYSVKEIAEMIVEFTGSKSEIVYQPLPQDDPTRRRPDLTRANKLGFEPSTKLFDGLNKTIEYFRKELSCLQ